MTTSIDELTSELYMSSKVVVSIYSVLFVISAIGNTTVFISLVKNRNRKLRINLLILNLTIADLIVTYIMIPMEIGWRITNQWLAGDLMCRVLQAFRAFGPYLSSMILVCVSLDRYFAVIHPLKVNDAHRRSKIMLTFAWLTSIVCSVPQTIVFHTASHPLFPDFVQCVSYNSLTEWQEIFYSTFGIAALYLIPLIIIICCYARILWEIYRRSKESTEDMQSSRHLIHRTESDGGGSTTGEGGGGGGGGSGSGRPRGRNNSYVSSGSGNHGSGSKSNHNKFHLRRSDIAQIEKARIRTLRMTIIIVLAFVFCWTPYASIVLLFHFYKQKVEDMQKDLKDALFMFAVSNSCVNPLVYGSYTMNFRAHFRRWLGMLCSANPLSPWSTRGSRGGGGGNGGGGRRSCGSGGSGNIDVLKGGRKGASLSAVGGANRSNRGRGGGGGGGCRSSCLSAQSFSRGGGYLIHQQEPENTTNYTHISPPSPLSATVSLDHGPPENNGLDREEVVEMHASLVGGNVEGGKLVITTAATTTEASTIVLS